MTLPLPRPQDLKALAEELLPYLDVLLSGYKVQQVVDKRSADQKLRVVANGSLQVQILSIDVALLSTPNFSEVNLATTLKDIANQALSGVIALVAPKITKEAGGWSLPGLPGYSQPLPDFAYFSQVCDAVSTRLLAALPTQSTQLYTARVGPVTAIVNGMAQVASVIIDQPLPLLPAPPPGDVRTAGLAQYLGDCAMGALNAALRAATDREADAATATQAILDGTPAFQFLVLYAKNSLKIGSSASVSGPSGAGVSASGGTVVTSIGAAAQVGRVVSVSAVNLLTNAKVVGGVRSAGAVSLAAGAQADSVVQNALVAPPELRLDVAFPSVAQPAVSVGAGTTRTLSPGYYSSISVSATGRLILLPGTYFCDTFSLQSGGVLAFGPPTPPAGSATQLYVKTSLVLAGTIERTPAVSSLFLGYLGTTAVAVNTPFFGTLAAPNAKITLAATGAISHLGSFHGNDIDVSANASVSHLPFSTAYAKLPGLVPLPAATDRSVHLGFEDISGWSCIQAPLTRVATPHNEGSFALSVSNVTGVVELYSPFFNTTNITTPITVPPGVASYVKFDLFLPTTPATLGQVQVYVTIPKSQVAGAVIGAATLNALPRNAFTTITLALPATTKAGIANGYNTQLRIVFSAGAITPGYTVVLDKIRFTATP